MAMQVSVAAFYKFYSLPTFASVQLQLKIALKALGARGSILLADEGINGTIAVATGQMAGALREIEAVSGCGTLEAKFSTAPAMPFKRLKVRLKKEIVSIGPVYAKPHELVGEYVDAKAWNDLISDPDTIVVDTRNAYEHRIGSFRGAIDPGTGCFSEFPGFARRELATHKHRKVAMFCTGGIRCEKATSFMKHEGFENVYHLKGGILKYLEDIPPPESLWEGACFVFDERVAVRHGLAVSDHSICHGCLMPVSADERASPMYEEGVSCPSCAGSLSDVQKASNRERQRQFVLARKRGTTHLGPSEG